MYEPIFRYRQAVRVRDVTLRDGLQSIPIILSTQRKIEIYTALIRAGVRELQITSFVNPSRVPQLADAEALCDALAGRPERRSVLTANLRGFERAIGNGVKEVEAVVSLSESYNEKNAHRTVRRSLDEIRTMAQLAPGSQCTLTVALANCYHCVFEGKIEMSRALATIEELTRYKIGEISLSDTTGYASPDQVYELSRMAVTSFANVRFGAHLHDTRGRGVANAMAALAAGVCWFDAALAGLGGSPFAPGMGGNLSLETLTDTLATMGIETGINSSAIVDVGAIVGSIINQEAGSPPA